MSKPRIKRDPTTGLYCCHPTYQTLDQQRNKVSGFGSTMEGAYTNYVMLNFKAGVEESHKRYLFAGGGGVVQEASNTGLSGERILYVEELPSKVTSIIPREVSLSHFEEGYYIGIPSPPPKKIVLDPFSWSELKRWWKYGR